MFSLVWIPKIAINTLHVFDFYIMLCKPVYTCSFSQLEGNAFSLCFESTGLNMTKWLEQINAQLSWASNSE